ncbi:hypothetical protein MY04_1533 [Flammeovirga sp. MY04]|uniref:hypothetical protein n=1 Tax=Flammeovirga sp. MY04 TaxID=1191459 RepID=UPI001305412C|nr:hypothetical protein [Flammeovirga sp. MY04]ANQ48909.2 hypothetical protein MY04_1533 [Flammeovirga sp. MY04]
MIKYEGVLSFDIDENNKKPHIALCFLTSCIGVGLLGLKFNFESYQSLWAPLFIVSSTVFIILIKLSELNFKSWVNCIQSLVVFICLFFYFFGLLLSINVLFDESSPTSKNGKISYKSKSVKLAYFSVDVKLEKEKVNHIQVDRQYYIQHQVDDNVTIQYHKGFLDIGWFHMEEAERFDFFKVL